VFDPLAQRFALAADASKFAADLVFGASFLFGSGLVGSATAVGLAMERAGLGPAPALLGGDPNDAGRSLVETVYLAVQPYLAAVGGYDEVKRGEHPDVRVAIRTALGWPAVANEAGAPA
jgi:hypothetical protein